VSNKLRVAIFAQSRDLSDEVLKKILKLKSKLNIILVVSDKEFKKKLKQNNLKDFVWLKNDKNNTSKICEALNRYVENDLYAISLQHRWRVKKKIIEKFKIFINFHYGDIPKYRGHHPVAHAILNNEKFIYGTIHSISEELDKGLFIGKVKVKNDKISSYDIEKKLTIKFANYFENLIIKLSNKQRLILKKIINKKNKFFSVKDIKKLKEVKNFKEIINKAYAFDYPPHEPAYIKIKNTKIYLRVKPN
tara:strand:+ start:2102 stop:2845 length:744 start_codon:yes stop_codon:yes gene_type:complete